MPPNPLSETLANFDFYELRLLLDAHFGGPGQHEGGPKKPKKLCLPRAGPSCRIKLTFRHDRITAIEPGQAFDVKEWERVEQEIKKSLLTGPKMIGRDYSFNSFRVLGSWRGDRSDVQILPPPIHAPRADVEAAEHPFILEFRMTASDCWPVTNHRRLREHRNLTLLLNVLLAGRTCLQTRRSEHFWAAIPRGNDGPSEIKWVQGFFFADLGEPVTDELSPPAGERLEEVEPDDYYTKVGHDGKGLRVPSDLDQSILLYFQLSSNIRPKFDRAIFWMDMASRQWNISVSASFAALVSAIESLAGKGVKHKVFCDECEKYSSHDFPGAGYRFKQFFETYAPESDPRKRDVMYSLRSDILHGSKLMQLDQDVAFGWDPLWWNERELHEELWVLTRIALRNWLKNPPDL